MDGEYCYQGMGRTLVLGGLLILSIGPLCRSADMEIHPYSAGMVSVVFREEKPLADEGKNSPLLTPEKPGKKAAASKLSPAPPADSISITLRNPEDLSQQTKIWTAAPDYSFRQPSSAASEGDKSRAPSELPMRIARSLPHADPAPSSPIINPSPKNEIKPIALAARPTTSISQTVNQTVRAVNDPIAPASTPIMPAVDPVSPPSPPKQVPLYQVSNQVTKASVAPAPQPEAAPSGELPPPPSIGGAPGSETTASAKPPEKLGEEPKNYNLEFLRRESVLLRPGEWQLDVELSYLYFEHYYTVIVTDPEILPLDFRARRRLLSTPLEFRYGLMEDVQLFVNTQFGWANTEYSTVGADDFFNEGGIGDTSAGGSILVRKSKGYGYSPDIVASFGITAPTGKGTSLLGILQSPEMTLGQGFWSGYWSVLFIHQYDPVILFYGFGSRHYLAKNIDVEGELISGKPGDQYIYQLGAGFAMNERITLSTTFFGSYITEPRLDNQVLEGGIQEPLYLRFAVTIARPPRRIIEPFVELGLTSDAADARAGITWTF